MRAMFENGFDDPSAQGVHSEIISGSWLHTSDIPHFAQCSYVLFASLFVLLFVFVPHLSSLPLLNCAAGIAKGWMRLPFVQAERELLGCCRFLLKRRETSQLFTLLVWPAWKSSQQGSSLSLPCQDSFRGVMCSSWPRALSLEWAHLTIQ